MTYFTFYKVVATKQASDEQPLADGHIPNIYKFTTSDSSAVFKDVGMDFLNWYIQFYRI
jgi:hypothetical protein